MEYTYEVRKLSNKFYHDYQVPPYEEIERKNTRGYATLLIDTHEDFFICIPFRSNIKHEYAYLFTSSVRSSLGRSGLDYTKICIIKDMTYISDTPGIVDKDEYKEMRDNILTIVNDACKFVDTYVLQKKGTAILSKRKFNKQYKFSTLRYFHKELGI